METTEESWARFRPAKQAKPTTGPRYYRHWGPNFRDKPAVGIGHFALWRNRFLEGPPKTAIEFRKKNKKPIRPSTAREEIPDIPRMPTPPLPVAEDWTDFALVDLVDHEVERLETLETPVQRRPTQPTPHTPETPRTPKAQVTKAAQARHAEAAQDGSTNQKLQIAQKVLSQRQSLSQRQRPAMCNDMGRKHDKLGRVQGGIVPVATSEPPSFGYGIPAVLKPLPPCAVATYAVEAADISPEERFRSTYKDQFRDIPLADATFQAPDYLPMRFVPAANRHVKDIALNVLGAHVARKG
mmetsp:Transcript_72800/g.115664  ORF Transcript_72800/g.115664 Transcript_72800/m.115664 type:complete len:297 (-) Transcript_72800:260-1150(-)